MRITTLASVVIPCLGFSASSIAAAEDVMIVSASGYEKKLTNYKLLLLMLPGKGVTKKQPPLPDIKKAE